MRFVLAIVLLVCALASAGLGIAQRTVLAGPDSVSLHANTAGGAPVTEIDGSALQAHPGSQRLTIIGRTSGSVFVAYGRTTDVRAWIGNATHTLLTYDATKAKLKGRIVAGSQSTVPAPEGSDLWLDSRQEPGSVTWPLQLPADYSVVAFGTGKDSAPTNVRITWPVDNSAPYSSLLISGGIALLVLGLLAFVWALVHARRRRGPRRNQPRLPRPPRRPQVTARRQRALPALPTAPARGRRRGFIAIPVVIATTLVLSGCSAASSFFPPAPSVSASPSPQVSGAAAAPPVAVLPSQLSSILKSVSSTIASADEKLDPALAATRLAGPALEEREANYLIRKADSTQAAEPTIPAGKIDVALPQQNALWPRTVFAVVGGDTKSKTAPMALMLIQTTPRAQYKVNYAIQLEPDALVPELAPESVGAPRVSPTVKYLRLAPAQLNDAYYSILLDGSTSPDYSLFDPKGDDLRTKLGQDYKASRKSSLPSSAAIAFTHAEGEGQTIVFGTNDGGAIVATDLQDIETVTPTEAGAAINPTGQVKLLSGLTQTTKGIEASYGLQLLFYVPLATTKKDQKPITLIGFTQGLISAKEVP